MNNEDYGELVGTQDLRTQEQTMKRQALAQIERLRAQMAICSGVVTLEGDQRFKSFLMEIGKLRANAMRELILAEPTKVQMLQGEVRAMDRILAICGSQQHVRNQLALTLKAEEDKLLGLIGPKDGPPNPANALWGKREPDNGRPEQRVDGRGDPAHGQVPSGEHRP